MELCLRPVRQSDEIEFRSAHVSLWDSDQFALGLDYRADEPFAAFVERKACAARGVGLPEGFVPATFLIALVDGEIVGRLSIRHELNEFLATEGGHIGYGVLKPHRDRGYATEILRQGLIVARSLGIESALLICDEANAASASVIERCGGILREKGVSSDGGPIRRYDIPLS